tara:strand:- start:5539 stop:6057 length:519 start_codon:yes stop_codon:yes gene_type:complete
MSSNHPKPGPNLVGAYQMSGIPFVTSSIASEVHAADSNSVSLTTKVSFPFVTKFITVRNTGINGLRMGFSADGIIDPSDFRSTVAADKPANGTRNYFLIPTGSSGTHGDVAGSIQTFEVRCKEVFFLSNAAVSTDGTTAARSTDFSLLAGLTPILASEFPSLTGSNGFAGVG